MKLNWYHHGNLKMANNVLYEIGVQIGAKIYVIGEKIDTFPKIEGYYKMIISELDLDAMKINQLLNFEYQRYCNVSLPHEVLAYGEYIIIFNPHNSVDRLEFLMINITTHKVETMTVRHKLRHYHVYSACIVEDHAYISLQHSHNELSTKLSIIAVNLKTWKKEYIKRPNAPRVLFRCYVRIIAHGKDIFYIGSQDSTVSIFNTVTKLWTKVEDSLGLLDNGYLHMIYGGTVYINNEVFIFKHNSDRSLASCTDIYNCNSKKWRREEKISVPAAYNSTYCTNCFAFNGKIFTIKNSNQIIKYAYNGLIQDDERFPKSDNMDICELDLNPSLERLCIITLIQNNLPSDKYPKFMQNELQRYIK